MFFEEELKKQGNRKVRIYLDMDGTIAHYDVAKADNFHLKRPLFERIDKIKYINDNYDNVTFYVLSIGNEDKHIDQKNQWLDEYLPFIKKENRAILVRKKGSPITSADVKRDYINSVETDDTILLIDDDPRVIGAIIKDNKNNVIVYKDTVLSD